MCTAFNKFLSKTNMVSAFFILLCLCATTIVVVFSSSLFNDLAMLASVTASKAEVASSNNKIGAGFKMRCLALFVAFVHLITGFHLVQHFLSF